MRERTRLADQVERGPAARARTAPTPSEFAELADAEGDEGSLDDAARPARCAEVPRGPAPSWKRCCRARRTATTPISKINSGAGGTESADWANMLLRMYTRWASAHGMDVELIEETAGEQAGIKSATLQDQAAPTPMAG